MTPMFRDNYSKNIFNCLYETLKRVSNYKDWDWGKEAADKIISKINLYAKFIEKDNGEQTISINWFGEELRDLMFILTNELFITYPGEYDYFAEIKKHYDEIHSDPLFYTKLDLKHFDKNAAFISKESERLLKKSKLILKFLNENINGLELYDSDFYNRYWQVSRILKTKSTQYNIQEISEGWKVEKIYKCEKENKIETTVFIINNTACKFQIENQETKEYKTEGEK